MTATGSTRRFEALLVLSEVVSNAIAHGSRSDDRVELAWTLAGGHLAVAVRDSARAATAPVVLAGDTTRESGRGLRVLDRLTESWNERITDGHREVTFSLALD